MKGNIYLNTFKILSTIPFNFNNRNNKIYLDMFKFLSIHLCSQFVVTTIAASKFPPLNIA